MVNFLIRNKHTIIYGISLAILLILLRWLQFSLIIFNNALELYIGAIALIFTALGIWLALKLTKPKVQIIEQIVEKVYHVESSLEFKINEEALSLLGLSRRELEVLELMSAGFSNQEIASQLFVSLNTIKTHTSKVFEKLDVKRRTQAIEKAKRMSLIP